MTEQTTKSEIQSLRSEPSEKGFKVIITGKGGAGKTTLTALLAQAFIEKNYHVLAVDEDPQMNLPFALGYPVEKMNDLTPLSQNVEYIEEKIGVKPGGWGAFLRLNPSVEDVIERFGLSLHSALNCLIMGTLSKPATGCLCPENALLDAVIRHITLRKNELILLDTQAGVEHFGRALSKGFSQCLVVTDATFNSMSVAIHAANLAREIGIAHIHLVINRIDGEKMKQRAMARLKNFKKSEADFDSIFTLPTEPELVNLEPAIIHLFQQNPKAELIQTIQSMTEVLSRLA